MLILCFQHYITKPSLQLSSDWALDEAQATVTEMVPKQFSASAHTKIPCKSV